MISEIESGPATTVIHRPFGGISGYRRVTDRASRASVHAFSMSELPRLAAAGLLSMPGAYILTDDRTAYVGESIRIARRLGEHSADPSKSFAKDVFVVSGSDGDAFDKSLLMDLQFRLSSRISDIAAVRLWGMSPSDVELSAAERSTNDRIFADAVRLLRDAACGPMAPARETHSVPPDRPCDEGTSEAADSGPIEIGVTTTPVGAEEFELRYDAVWARGYWANGHFIVSAGSEIRAQTNGSCDPITRSRREELFRSGALAPIPGVDDRHRLVGAVAFPSVSIAAKIICGAHTPGRWVPLARSGVVVLGGLRVAS